MTCRSEPGFATPLESCRKLGGHHFPSVEPAAVDDESPVARALFRQDDDREADRRIDHGIFTSLHGEVKITPVSPKYYEADCIEALVVERTCSFLLGCL